MRVLNLYAGLGGNRAEWDTLPELEITAVEQDDKIARIYSHLYPHDTVVVGDAHEYLRQHFAEFDFIWSSPPCQSHSGIRFHRAVQYLGSEPLYPDLELYEEILFLRHNRKGPSQPWVVENVNPYYETLIAPSQSIDRHLYWSNFGIGAYSSGTPENLRAVQIPDLEQMRGVDLSAYSLSNKRQALRNMVPADVGLHILRSATETTLW